VAPVRSIPEQPEGGDGVTERHGRVDRSIDLLGARNAAIQNRVAEVPPPLVAELLGYSYQVAHRHAEIAAQPWSQHTT
jgi:hypothetical protein